MMACWKMTMNRLFAVVLAALSVTAFGQQAPGGQRVFAPEGTPITLGLAGYAKVLCSAVFVSGREPAEAFRNSGFFLFPDEHRAGVTYAVDRDRKLVRMTHGATTRVAKFYGDQGCIIHPQDRRRHLFHAGTGEDDGCPTRRRKPWPMGDAPSHAPLPAGLDAARARKRRSTPPSPIPKR